jgi:acyl-ACP thioesterase
MDLIIAILVSVGVLLIFYAGFLTGQWAQIYRHRRKNFHRLGEDVVALYSSNLPPDEQEWRKLLEKKQKF